MSPDIVQLGQLINNGAASQAMKLGEEREPRIKWLIRV
jgi:hypothetical protein